MNWSPFRRDCPDCGGVYDLRTGHDCPVTICPYCNEEYRGPEDSHNCPERPATAREECFACGAAIDSFLTHMSGCPGPEDVADQSESGVDGTEPDEPTAVASVGDLDEDR